MALSLVISLPVDQSTPPAELGELLGVIAADLADADGSAGWAVGEVFTYRTRLGSGVLATVSVVDATSSR